MSEKKNKTQATLIATIASIFIVVLSNISIIRENVPTLFYILILVVSLLTIFFCIHTARKIATNILNNKFDNVYSNIDKLSNKLTEDLSQNTTTILESIGNSTNQIKDILNDKSLDFNNSFISLDHKITSSIDALIKRISENANEVIKMQESFELLKKELVNLGISVNTNIADNTDLLKQSIVDEKNRELTTREKIITSITDNYNLISHLINQLANQTSILQETLHSAKENLNEKTEVINTVIKESAQTLTDTTSSLFKSVETHIGDGINTITMLVNQTETAKSASEKHQQIITNINAINEEKQNLYLENITETNKILGRLDTRSKNIQAVLDEFKNNDAFTNIITSINGIIDVMRGEIIEVSNMILDSQVSQETLQQQLINLNVVLRTLEKSIQTPVKEVKEHPKKENISLNPNRTETILDEVTKNIVENTYINGNINKTMMRNPQGKLIYEMEYKSGVIDRTKNYDEKGKVNIEQTYHSNGQVHLRIEYTKSGKITTEFDRNGNIIK